MACSNAALYHAAAPRVTCATAFWLAIRAPKAMKGQSLRPSFGPKWRHLRY
jgi:hypothetical protein